MYKILLRNYGYQLTSRKIGKNGKKSLPPWTQYLLIAVLYAFLSFSMFSSLVQPLIASGYGWLCFAMMAGMAFSLLLMFDISLVQSTLYESKYNDVLLAMPIKSDDILISRLIYLYLYDLMLMIVEAAGVLIAVFRVIPFDIMIVLRTLVVCLLLPLLPMALSCVAGYFINRISKKVKHKTAIRTGMYIAFLVVYYVIVFSGESFAEDIISRSNEIANSLSTVAALVWAGRGILENRPLYLVYFALLCIIPFIVACIFTRSNFLTALTQTESYAKTQYKEKPVKVRSQMGALLFKELKRLGSSSTYIINIMTPVVMSIVVPFLMYFTANSEIPADDEISEILNLVFMLIASGTSIFLICTYAMSAISISLEAKSMEILKSLPVDVMTIFNSKLLFHFIWMSVAQLICSIIITVLYQIPAGYHIPLFIVPQFFLLFTSVLGLIINLRHPKMDWENEAQVVKRGASVLIFMLVSALVLLGLGALYGLVLRKAFELPTYLYLCCGILLAGAIGGYIILTRWGVRKFMSL